jgi:hypothetical protein
MKFGIVPIHLLGQQHPTSVVIGVDRSMARLTKNQRGTKEYIPVDCRGHKISATVEMSDGQQNSNIPPTNVLPSAIIVAASVDSTENDPTTLVEQVASNVWLVRAELIGFWRLMIQHQMVHRASFFTISKSISEVNTNSTTLVCPSILYVVVSSIWQFR